MYTFNMIKEYQKHEKLTEDGSFEIYKGVEKNNNTNYILCIVDCSKVQSDSYEKKIHFFDSEYRFTSQHLMKYEKCKYNKRNKEFIVPIKYIKGNLQLIRSS